MGTQVGIGLELEDFRLQQDLVEQLLDALAALGRDLGAEHLSAELLEHDVLLQQVLLDLLHIGRGQVDLVDRHDQRHAGVAGVRDGLDRLRHDLVVGGDHQHDNVRHLGPAGTHGREGLMARRVEEGDLALARQFDVVRADVLRNAARFASDHVRLADVVEERRLAVVDVAHDRHDGRTREECTFIDRSFGFDLGMVLLFLHRFETER